MDAKQDTIDLARELQDAINTASPEQLPSYREAARNVTEALAALGAEFKFTFPGETRTEAKLAPKTPKTEQPKATEPPPKATVPDSQLHPIEGNPKGEVLVKTPEPPKPKEGDKVLVYINPSEPPHLGTVGKFWTGKGHALGVEYIGRKGEPLPAIYSEVVKPFDPAVQVRSIIGPALAGQLKTEVNGPQLKRAIELVLPLAKAVSKGGKAALNSILCEVKGGRLWLTATDLNTQLSQSIPAKGDEWSALLGYSKALEAILTRLDDAPSVMLEYSAEQEPYCSLVFGFGRGQTRTPKEGCIQVSDAAQWQLRRAPDSAGEVLDAAELTRAMKAAARAIKGLNIKQATKGNLPLGFLVSRREGGYTLAASDRETIRVLGLSGGSGGLDGALLGGDTPRLYLGGAWDKAVTVKRGKVTGSDTLFFEDADTRLSVKLEDRGAYPKLVGVERIAQAKPKDADWVEVDRARLLYALKQVMRLFNASRETEASKRVPALLGTARGELWVAQADTPTMSESAPTGEGVMFAMFNIEPLAKLVEQIQSKRVKLAAVPWGDSHAVWVSGDGDAAALMGVDLSKPEQARAAFGYWTKDAPAEALALRVAALAQGNPDPSLDNSPQDTLGGIRREGQAPAPTKPAQAAQASEESDDMKKGKKASTKATKTTKTTKPAPKTKPERIKADSATKDAMKTDLRAEAQHKADMKAHEEMMERKRVEAAAMMERAKANRAKTNPKPSTKKTKPAPTPERKTERKTEGKVKNPNVIKVTPKNGELRITDTYPPKWPIMQARRAEGFAWDKEARCWRGPDSAKTRGACEAWGLKVGGEVLARDLVGRMSGTPKAEPKATMKADTKPAKTEPKKADKGGIVETVKEAAASVVDAVMGKPDKKTKGDKPKGGKPKGGKKGGGKPKNPTSARPARLPRSWAQLECMSGAELRRVYPSALGKDASDNAKPAALRQEIAAALGITVPESCSHNKRVTVNLTTEARTKLAEGGGSVSGKIRDVLVKQGIEKRCQKNKRRCGKDKKAA